MQEGRNPSVENAFKHQTCKFLSGRMGSHPRLIKTEFLSSQKTLDNAAYVIVDAIHIFMGTAQNSKALNEYWPFYFIFSSLFIKMSGKQKIDDIDMSTKKYSSQKCNTIKNQEGEHGADKSINFQLQSGTY